MKSETHVKKLTWWHALVIQEEKLRTRRSLGRLSDLSQSSPFGKLQATEKPCLRIKKKNTGGQHPRNDSQGCLRSSSFLIQVVLLDPELATLSRLAGHKFLRSICFQCLVLRLQIYKTMPGFHVESMDPNPGP